MIEEVTVRRIGAGEAQACIEALTDVLIDCVEGGASVSFMLPLPREKALGVQISETMRSHRAQSAGGSGNSQAQYAIR